MASPSNDRTPTFDIVSTNNSDVLLSLLRNNCISQYLIIRHPASKSSTSSNVIEQIYAHRRNLQFMHAIEGEHFTSNQWYMHHGQYWPDDLSTVRGPWSTPLPFSFTRLTILDLNIEDAVYWLIPILNAVIQDAPLRRLILRGCVDHDDYVHPFQFGALDDSLSRWPLARLLIAWAVSEKDPFIAHWRSNLPTLQSAGRVDVLYSGGPLCM
jgi:hypothetical protein